MRRVIASTTLSRFSMPGDWPGSGPRWVLVLVASATVATFVVPRAWLSGFSEIRPITLFFGLSNWAMENNVDTYFAPRAEFNPYTHTWSLSLEEQFYLDFPFLFFAWVRLRERKSAQRLATALTALLGLASFIDCISGCNRQESRRPSCCNLFLPPVSPFCLMRPNPYFGAPHFAARTCSMPPTPFVGAA